MVLIYSAAFILSLLLAFVMTWCVRNLASRRGWIVAPLSARHIHQKPIPRLGGVAIFFSSTLVVGLVICATRAMGLSLGGSQWNVLYILMPGALVFLLGLYDDFRPVTPYVKFGVQAVAAALLFFIGFRVIQLPVVFDMYSAGWLALPLTILWVLWITNAFNLIDGLDGLAAGSALFSTITVFVISLISGNYMVSLLTVSLAGAILGFLRFNFNPATIFLGDCGSLFIGFMLSALALAGSQKTSTAVAVAIPVVSFGLPILDTMLAVLRRFLNGKPLFSADREHIHHKLLDRGFSHKQVVITLYGISACCALLSLFLLYPGGGAIGIVLLVLGAGVWLGVQHLGYHEFSELSRVAQRTVEQKQVIANNLAIRRAAVALSRATNSQELSRILQDAFEGNDFDGFQLHPIVLPSKAPLAVRNSHMRGLSKYQSLMWHRTYITSESIEKPAPVWTLTLNLISKQNNRCGYFSLFRTHSDRPLLVDINILFSGFHIALADAVDRIMCQAEPAADDVAGDLRGDLLGGALFDKGSDTDYEFETAHKQAG